MPKPKEPKGLTVSKAQCHWRWGNNPANDEHKGQRVAVWTSSYSKTVEQAVCLAEILKADFPGVKDDEIEIVIYDGSTKKGVMGAEFDPGDKKIPKDYLVWDKFDPSN